eukprot:354081_1
MFHFNHHTTMSIWTLSQRQLLLSLYMIIFSVQFKLVQSSPTPIVCSEAVCNITCDASTSCTNLTIDASQSTILNLRCNTIASCSYLQLKEGPSAAAFIYCADDNSCSHAQFDCSRTQDIVNLHCEGADDPKFTCEKIILDAPNTAQIGIYCDAGQACEYSIFHIENANTVSIVVSEWLAIGNGKLFVSNIQQTLDITCNKNACRDIEIYANPMAPLSAFNLLCDTYMSCEGAQVHCPMQSVSCNIRCSESLSCANMNIFVENDQSIYDLNMECVPGGNAEYHVCNGVTIECLNSALSTTLQNTGSGVWCDNDDCCPYNTRSPSKIITQSPTNQPSTTPSEHPSLQTSTPSAPTTHPSIGPSMRPTIQTNTPSVRTNHPSTVPSKYPTVHTSVPTTATVVPSTAPTTQPSGSPIIHPTVNPTNPQSFPTKSQIHSYHPTQFPSNPPAATPSAYPSVETSAPSAQTTHPSTVPSQYATIQTSAPATAQLTTRQASVSIKPTSLPSLSPTKYVNNTTRTTVSHAIQTELATLSETPITASITFTQEPKDGNILSFVMEHIKDIMAFGCVPFLLLLVCLLMLCCRKCRTRFKAKKSNAANDANHQVEKKPYNKIVGMEMMQDGRRELELKADDSKSSDDSIYDNPKPNKTCAINTRKRVNRRESLAPIKREINPHDAGGVAFVIDTKQPNNRISRYAEEWTTQELLNWISQLEHGRYKMHMNKLDSAFMDEQVDGSNIGDLDAQDLRNYGLNLLSDRKTLLKHFEKLINSEMYRRQLEGHD